MKHCHNYKEILLKMTIKEEKIVFGIAQKNKIIKLIARRSPRITAVNILKELRDVDIGYKTA